MILAADIGGTRSRLALFREEGPLRPLKPRIFPSRDFRGLSELLRSYLEEVRERPRRVVLALAGPILGARVHLTNLGWTVSVAGLKRNLGFEEVFLLNDLEAAAYGIPVLSGARVRTVKAGGGRGRVAVVVAPGTGLGEAILVRSGPRPLVLPTEGGHAEYPPASDEEWALYRELRRRYGHVSLERVISGPGLTEVYAFFSGETVSPEEIIERARGGDPPADRAVRLVTRALGREAGTLALKTLALGGVYLSGGLAPALSPWFENEFLPAFLDKGRLREILLKIPVRLITHPAPALLGAAFYARSMRISRSSSER